MMIKLERTSKEQFDKQASHYDAQWNTWSQETLEWLVGSSDAVSTDRVLDVATGTGFTALAFANQVSHVIGVDVSTGMLTQARLFAERDGITNIEFVEGAAEDLPFDDASFDIVTSRIAPHHFLNIDKFAQEAERVLRVGGRLVIVDTSVPADDFIAAIWQNEVERIRDPSHVKNYSPREWTQILERAGLTIDTISDSGPGIRIPLADWIYKAGCTPSQEAEVRRRFADAPANVRRRYLISDDNGVTNFTWLRVLIKAVKTD